MEELRTWPPGVDVEKLAEAVSIVTARVYSRYVKVRALDDSDVSQELWMFAWKRREKIREYMDREGRQAQRKGWSALLTMLERAAQRYCLKVKAKEGGYRLQDLVWYTPDSIKDWIGVMVNGVGVLTNQVDENTTRTSLASESWNLEATVADIDSALSKLDVLDRYILIEAYGHLTARKEIAKLLEISESTLDRRLADGLNKMVELLGGHRPW